MRARFSARRAFILGWAAFRREPVRRSVARNSTLARDQRGSPAYVLPPGVSIPSHQSGAGESPPAHKIRLPHTHTAHMTERPSVTMFGLLCARPHAASAPR